MSVESSRPLLQSAENPGSNYDREPTYRVDRARHGRHGADARRRQNLRRCLSPRRARKIPGAARLRHLQQGFSGPRHGGGVAAAAGMVAAVDRADGGRRHQVLRVARLCPCHRLAARRRQIGRRRLARVGLLRPDRVDRGAALVRRQCRHGRHFRFRRRAARGRQEAAAASAKRSSRSTRAAPMASSAASATNIRAASFICSVIWSAISRRCISTRGRPARCRRSAKSCGARP